MRNNKKLIKANSEKKIMPPSFKIETETSSAYKTTTLESYLKRAYGYVLYAYPNTGAVLRLLLQYLECVSLFFTPHHSFDTFMFCVDITSVIGILTRPKFSMKRQLYPTKLKIINESLQELMA